MIYKRFNDAKEFYRATFSILMKHEAQNTLPLGNVVLGNNGGEPDGWRNTRNWYMAAISDDSGGILLVAIMTPPFNITLYETDNIPNDDALNCLCENIFKENTTVPGVTSENGLADRFSKFYTAVAGMTYSVHKHMRIYTLDRINENVKIIGQVRQAEKKDLCFLPYWYSGFSADCDTGSISVNDAFANISRAMNHQSLFVLEKDGMPVSMASILREIITGRCVRGVYTPPYFRNNGYASSCVAQVSKLVLDKGYQYVSLFTDLANPTSNSIYQKIGYKPICDYNEVTFLS